MLPKVSVVVPVKNGEAYIAQALQSIFAQDYEALEVIVVDDGSTDKTQAVVKNFSATKPLRLITITQSKGVSNAINLGIDAATGKYFARLDCDDIWVDSAKLSSQVRFLEDNPDHILVGTRAIAGYKPGEKLYSYNHPLTDSEIRQRILLRNPIVSSSLLARIDGLKFIQGYHHEDWIAEDYGLVLRLAKLGKLANLEKESVWYRLSEQGLSKARYVDQVASARQVVSVLGRGLPKYRQAKLKWLFHFWVAKLFKMNFTFLKKYF